MQRADMAVICAGLVAAFPAWAATEHTIEMYLAMLGDLDAELVLRAAEDWILEEEKYPTIAGLRKRCAEIAKVTAPDVTEAWLEVTDALERYGREFYAKGGKWSDPLIAKAVKVVGYSTLCFSDAIGVERATFVKAYEKFRKEHDAEIIRSKNFVVGNGVVALPYSTMVGSKELSN